MLISFHSVFTMMIFVMIRFSYSLPSMVDGMSAMGRIEAFLGQEPSPNSEKETTPLRFKRSIEFSGVSFGYSNQVKNIYNINFSIHKNSFTAFVGTTGSGKSTVVSLILGFFTPSEGTIQFDGADMSTLNEESVHANMGYVPQEIQLFNLSIGENIRMGKLDATEGDVIEAAKNTDFHDSIMQMPDGYKTLIGEGGRFLSSGQKQRLGIARAIIKKPEILILDETTVSLDPATEAAVNMTLMKLAQNCTTISLTHRLTTVMHADCIYVLDKGEIKESGNHAQLIGMNGFYRKLWDKQHECTLTLTDEHVNVDLPLASLRNIEIFNPFPDDLLQKIHDRFSTLNLPENRIIMRTGDESNFFYIIARGKVEVSRKIGYPEKEVLVYLEDGDHFGEIALLKSIKRTATIRTVTPCIFLTLARQDFLKLVDEFPMIRKALERIIVEREKQ
jgi:ATP-binding cassette subfamily B protein